MKSRVLFSLWGLLILASHASASGECVRVRAQNGYSCMKFSETEKQVARSYGLRLGASYAEVKRTLVRQGWQLDRNWVREQSSSGKKRELVCGAGYDALCSTAFVRRDRHAYLTFSGTKADTPLIGVSDHD
jgi:hypothetical protein